MIPMRTKIGHKDGGGKQQRRENLPEVRAGLVLVKSKDAGRTRRPRRTWVLPVLRVLALAASMLCLTPTGGMVTGMSKMDAWSAGSEPEQQHEDRRSTGYVCAPIQLLLVFAPRVVESVFLLCAGCVFVTH